jgi:hypothetical protein
LHLSILLSKEEKQQEVVKAASQKIARFGVQFARGQPCGKLKYYGTTRIIIKSGSGCFFCLVKIFDFTQEVNIKWLGFIWRLPVCSKSAGQSA